MLNSNFNCNTVTVTVNLAGPWGNVPGFGSILPYGAMSAMDYAAASASSFHTRQSPVNPAFTHSCILELRKEKSRDAARSRRGKENYEFYELAKMLPLPAAITSQLDKASIIRLTISYLRIKDFSAHGDPPWLKDNPLLNKKGVVRASRSSGNATLDLFEQHQGTHILQSLDGFAFALAADGRFLYISETVSIYLGLSQVEMTGSSVFDYIHPNDHAELAEQLGLGLSHGPGTNVPSPAGSDDGSSNSATNNPDVSSLMSITSNAGYKGLDRAFCIRMKSTLTKRGCHFKSSGYRVVLVLCRLRAQYSFSLKRGAPPPLLGMVALAIALPPPSVHEIRLESDMFVTKVTFDFRIIHCEPRVSELLDYTSEELMGRNLYALCHAEDVNKLRKCHVDLLDKGQVMSQYYRLLNKNGGYLWIQTCATVVSNSKNSDEQNIICVNYVISGKEYPYMIMDCCQLEQEILVKREIITEGERETKVSQTDSAGGNSSVGRDISSGSSIREPPPISKRSPQDSDRSTDLPGDGTASASTQSRRLGIENVRDSASVTLPNSDDQIDRTRYPAPETFGIPQALDKQPPMQPAIKGRKRKAEKPGQSLPLSSPNHESISSQPTTKFNSSKRQIIVPNETVDDNAHLAVNGIGAKNLLHEIGSKSTSDQLTDAESGRSGKSGNHQNHGHWETPAGSSVKRLEQVMSKHLGGQELEHMPTIGSSGLDFSTDSLLSQRASSRSGVSGMGGGGTDSDSGHGLPVSTLLRQLCASRESVIRANVQAAALTTRGGSSYYQDMCTVQSALPTPPGSDTYGGESQFMLGSHHHSSSSVGGSHKKSSSTSYFPSLVPYPTVSSTDSQPSLTPPASVSPRDKRSYSSTGTTETVNSYGESSISSNNNSTSFRPPPHLYMDGPAQPLPLKPQVYGYHPHSSLESQYGNPFGDPHTQSQLYAPTHTGFHLYHPGKPSYGEALKNANWY